MNEPPELSILYPVFDEAGNVPTLLDETRRWAPRVAGRFEVIVVDDGSRDGSVEAVERARAGDARIRIVRHERNRGYGAALRTGLRAARGRLIFFTDADLQFDLSELEGLLAHAESFDVVAGYRAPRRDPWPRRVLAFGWGTIVRAVFGLRVRDIDCAFKVFRREVIDAIPIASIGAFVNTEILLRAEQAGFRIHQVPVTHHPRRHGRQSGARPRVIGRALLELGRFWRELRREPGAAGPTVGGTTVSVGRGAAGVAERVADEVAGRPAAAPPGA
ncbi:MAG TPA: glycosyltransferase family 2 protein [Myxococcota bacterium]|nr:glycosyltransferase family 2 protein [Myxococcota bacterium]